MNDHHDDPIDLENPEMQQALQIIQFTHRSLFLTGKAGTGKSTFLRYVALAPTGIAAINAGGSTLHSFFKIPFHPLVPNDIRYTVRHLRDTLKYNAEKIKIIKSLELIIIDEVSMVRADIIDFIDKVLRVYCHRMREPFGGKQLLLVGDVYQLEPVVKEEDRQLLSPFYRSAFFFEAHVFQQLQLVSIELRKVYRQSDPTFLHILDHIRSAQVTDADLQRLNLQVESTGHLPPSSPATLSEAKDSQQLSESSAPSVGNKEGGKKQSNELSITLSTRRDTVDFINEKKLALLPGNPAVFMGMIEGEFPLNSLPTPQELHLKLGAQVLFVKNDRERRWVNGTLGTIIAFDEDEQEHILVRTEDGEEVDVELQRAGEKDRREGVGNLHPVPLAAGLGHHCSQESGTHLQPRAHRLHRWCLRRRSDLRGTLALPFLGGHHIEGSHPAQRDLCPAGCRGLCQEQLQQHADHQQGPSAVQGRQGILRCCLRL